MKMKVILRMKKNEGEGKNVNEDERKQPTLFLFDEYHQRPTVSCIFARAKIRN